MTWIVRGARSPEEAAQAVARVKAQAAGFLAHAGAYPYPRPATRVDIPVGPAQVAGMHAGMHAGMIPEIGWRFTPEELSALNRPVTRALRETAQMPWHGATIAGAGVEPPCFTFMGLVFSGLGGLAVGMALGGLIGWLLANAMQVGTMVAPVAAGALKGAATKLPLLAAA